MGFYALGVGSRGWCGRIGSWDFFGFLVGELDFR